jgi:hypothetical protein
VAGKRECRVHVANKLLRQKGERCQALNFFGLSSTLERIKAPSQEYFFSFEQALLIYTKLLSLITQIVID